MWAKSFMKVLWTKGVSPDEQLPTDMCKKWTEFIHNLPLIKNIQISRQIPLTIKKVFHLMVYMMPVNLDMAAVSILDVSMINVIQLLIYYELNQG